MLLGIAPRVAWKVRSAIAELFVAKARQRIRSGEWLIETCPVPGSTAMASAELHLALAELWLTLARTFLGMEDVE